MSIELQNQLFIYLIFYLIVSVYISILNLNFNKETDHLKVIKKYI